jgi:hypothetical protein
MTWKGSVIQSRQADTHVADKKLRKESIHEIQNSGQPRVGFKYLFILRRVPQLFIFCIQAPNSTLFSKFLNCRIYYGENLIRIIVPEAHGKIIWNGPISLLRITVTLITTKISG